MPNQKPYTPQGNPSVASVASRETGEVVGWISRDGGGWRTHFGLSVRLRADAAAHVWAPHEAKVAWEKLSGRTP